jgi:hypothetical protein
LSIKFSATDAYKGDQKLKKDYHDLLNHLLDSISVIINDSFKVTYAKGYNFLIAFPPQVYELMQRFGPKYQGVVTAKANQAANQVKQ